MATTAQQLFTELRNTQLSDKEAVTWPDADLLIALNGALSMLTLVRPDATATTTVMTLVDGTRQSIPSDGQRFLRLLRNVGSDGRIGRAIKFMDINSLDAMAPDWHSTPATTAIYEYGFDKNTPKEFYVYPAAATGMRVELQYSKQPTRLTSTASIIPVDDIYNQPLQELMLYKLMSGDNGSGVTTGQNHLNTAMTLLQVKVAAEASSSPRRKNES
jgi:hypothetical protein